MRRLIVFILASFVLSPGCTYANDVKGRLEMPEICKDDIIIDYEGFTVSYNSETLTPKWVAYELTKEEVDGKYSRSGSFSMDLNYYGKQAMREDYANSTWDKGHMAPAADMKWSEQAMKESFYLTNICPQNHTLNGKSWHSLEKRVRKWAQQYGSVYTVCGPIYSENRYGRIGKNGVHVPDAFFKAIMVPYEDSYSAVAFIMDNDSFPHPLSECYMSIDELEMLIDTNLFVNLNLDKEEVVEREVIRSVWSI